MFSKPKGQKSTVIGKKVAPGGNPGWGKLTGGAQPIGKQGGSNSGGSKKMSGSKY